MTKVQSQVPFHLERVPDRGATTGRSSGAKTRTGTGRRLHRHRTPEPLRPMSSTPIRRFIQTADAIREANAWTNNEWLCRPDLVAAEKLLMVRANMDAMHCHPFHYHPHREEIIFVLYGRAEQWVGTEHRILSAGEMAHIPAGTIHATYNPHREPLVFLAILSPASLPADLAAVPDPFDVSGEEPWASLRKDMVPCQTLG
jgi:quercetin dioxygenase-like cupin family protein